MMDKIESLKKLRAKKTEGKYYELLAKLRNKDRRHYNNTHPSENNEEIYTI
jgi:hypothetical protein